MTNPRNKKVLPNPDDDEFHVERAELIQKTIGTAARTAWFETASARYNLCSLSEFVEGYYGGLNPHPCDHTAWISEWDNYA